MPLNIWYSPANPAPREGQEIHPACGIFGPILIVKNILDTDLFIIADIPDNVSAALTLTVNAAGGASAKITVLLTAEEVDAAAKKTPNYRPPGK